MNDLKFAIDMEHDGEKYYRQQAEINKNNSLHSVCLMLAEDEKKHAQILADKIKGNPCQLIDTDTLAKAKNIFEGIGDIKIDGIETASQLDFYRIATDKERQSIEFYKKYLLQAEDDNERALFEYLIRQEEQHFEVLDELVDMLRRAEEWVEHAEFGLRKEY